MVEQLSLFVITDSGVPIFQHGSPPFPKGDVTVGANVGFRQFELHDDDDMLQTVRCRQLMMIINIEYICVRLNLQTVSKLRNFTRKVPKKILNIPFDRSSIN